MRSRTKRQPSSPHVSTLAYRKVHGVIESLLDGTATVPAMLDDLADAERLIRSIDARRAEVDPSLGGKVK